MSRPFIVQRQQDAGRLPTLSPFQYCYNSSQNKNIMPSFSHSSVKVIVVPGRRSQSLMSGPRVVVLNKTSIGFSRANK